MIKFNSFSIVVKLGLLFSALSALLAGAIGFSSYRISRTVIRRSQRETLDMLTRNISGHIYAFTDLRREELALILDNRAIGRFLSTGDKTALAAHLRENSRGFLSLSYFSPAGKLQAATANAGALTPTLGPELTAADLSSGYTVRPWYSGALKTHVLELDYSDPASAKPRGRLKAFVDFKTVVEDFAGMKIGHGGFFIITSRNGQILYNSESKTHGLNFPPGSSDPGMERLIKTGEGTGLGLLNGTRSYAEVITLPQFGWRITAAIPEQEDASPLGDVKRGILLISLLIGAVSIFAGLIAANVLITRPMSRLTKAVRDISESRDLEARVPVQNNDEIGTVARAFNAMLAELSEFHKKSLGQTQEELSSAQAQLRQAQKMELVGRLAGGVAHDFNNLLTVILANCTFLLNDLPEGDPRREDVKGIRGAGERAVTLTRQLLAFSRKQILQPRLIDLNASLTDTQKIIKRLIGENIQVKTTLDPALPRVKADPGQIEQIIMNLSVNARDAMPGGGTLHFATATLQILPGARLEHAPVGLPPGKYTALTVADTGTGMNENTLAHLFEPFFTTKEEGKGTGLGLAMVYGIIKQSGGFIDVKSTPGSGAVFTIYLPAAAAAAAAAPAETEKAAVPAAASTAAGTILLVEDDEDLIRMTARILKGAGFAVMEAATAAAALNCLDKDFRLLLTDVTLPDISGVDLAAQVVKARPGTPVIFTSGYSESEELRGILSSPENNFIQKPFSNEALLRKIQEVLGRAAAPKKQ